MFGPPIFVKLVNAKTNRPVFVYLQQLRYWEPTEDGDKTKLVFDESHSLFVTDTFDEFEDRLKKLTSSKQDSTT